MFDIYIFTSLLLKLAKIPNMLYLFKNKVFKYHFKSHNTNNSMNNTGNIR
jgi:hypothetical protein